MTLPGAGHNVALLWGLVFSRFGSGPPCPTPVSCHLGVGTRVHTRSRIPRTPPAPHPTACLPIGYAAAYPCVAAVCR